MLEGHVNHEIQIGMSKIQSLWNCAFIKPGNVWNQIISKILIFDALKVKEDGCGKDENCSVRICSG